MSVNEFDTQFSYNKYIIITTYLLVLFVSITSVAALISGNLTYTYWMTDFPFVYVIYISIFFAVVMLSAGYGMFFRAITNRPGIVIRNDEISFYHWRHDVVKISWITSGSYIISERFLVINPTDPQLRKPIKIDLALFDANALNTLKGIVSPK